MADFKTVGEREPADFLIAFLQKKEERESVASEEVVFTGR